MSHIRTGNRPRWGGKRSNDLPNNRLQRTLKGRGETLVVLLRLQRPRPFKAAETYREADANSRAASRRGCTRHRILPLAGEPRG